VSLIIFILIQYFDIYLINKKGHLQVIYFTRFELIYCLYLLVNIFCIVIIGDEMIMSWMGDYEMKIMKNFEGFECYC
jgi:hypothetical protein